MKKRDLLIVAVGAVLFAFILNAVFRVNSEGYSFLSPLPEGKKEAANAQDTNQSKELKALLDPIFDNASGTYGIVIKNLRTGEIYARNENRKFQTASLYKLWVAATAFKQIDEGNLARTQTMSQDIAELNRLFNISEENAEQTEGALTRTVTRALNEMITISANYPALLLSEQIGNSNIATYMQELDLSSSSLGQPPTTTPRDIAKFYELLYEGEIVNQEYSAEFIDILSQQTFNDRIPKYLPDNIRVAHKTGELGAFKHDAGIIFASDTILFVALSETASHATAAETIANVSKAIYEYFESK